MLRLLVPMAALALFGCSKEPSPAPGVGAQGPATPNLVVDGDCEGEALAGWEPTVARGQDVPGWKEPEKDASVCFSGSRSIRLGPVASRVGQSTQCVSQTVSVPSSNLWIDGWVRLDGSVTGGSGGIRAALEFQFLAGDDPVGDVVASITPTPSLFPNEAGVVCFPLSTEERSAWVRLPHHAMAELEEAGLKLKKPPRQVKVALWLQTFGAVEGRAWFDDLVVKETK